MRQKLPTTKPEFADLRANGYRYVDKTAIIHRLVTDDSTAFFLSRPRRFGKSLLCSTLRSLFEGRRELFGAIAGQPATAIDSLEWDWEPRPVIHIDFGTVAKAATAMLEWEAILDRDLEAAANQHGLSLTGVTMADKFVRLARALHEQCGRQAVVIIDEYDMPLLSTLDHPKIHDDIRGSLKEVYGAIKASGAHLRFVLFTGITKFFRVSVFSGLNQLDDISFQPAFAAICGITPKEIEDNFEPEIAAIVKLKGTTREQYFKDLHDAYNGYRFSCSPLAVYNTFGLLHHLKNDGKFSAYWHDSATPTFLVKLIKDRKINILNLTRLTVHERRFGNFIVDNLDAEPLLYQTGYLTITDYNEKYNEYTLDFPNNEVRRAFADSLLEHYLGSLSASNSAGERLVHALRTGDIKGTMDALTVFLAGIPYDIVTNTESYYRTVMHLIFTVLGVSCRSELRIAAGRIDSLVETDDYVYCFEFKLDKSAESALRQIDTKEYLLPWTGTGKTLFKVGVKLSSKKRNIGAWTAVSIPPSDHPHPLRPCETFSSAGTGLSRILNTSPFRSAATISSYIAKIISRVRYSP